MIVEEKGNPESILFIKRKHSPYKGKWALPGGYLNCGKETLEEAGIRELEEETSLISKTKDLTLIGVYSDPKRDPRGHVISHAYFVYRYSGTPKAKDDAQKYKWFKLDSLPPLAFDHARIMQDYINWKRIIPNE
jgi:8-oxo-dGTP diphosphatase